MNTARTNGRAGEGAQATRFWEIRKGLAATPPPPTPGDGGLPTVTAEVELQAWGDRDTLSEVGWQEVDLRPYLLDPEDRTAARIIRIANKPEWIEEDVLGECTDGRGLPHRGPIRIDVDRDEVLGFLQASLSELPRAKVVAEITDLTDKHVEALHEHYAGFVAAARSAARARRIHARRLWIAEALDGLSDAEAEEALRPWMDGADGAGRGRRKAALAAAGGAA